MSLVRLRDDAPVVLAVLIALVLYLATIISAYNVGVLTERARRPNALESGCPAPRPGNVQCPDTTGQIPRARR